MNEAERIREAVSELTGARFEIRETSALPAVFARAVWFMRCREITQASKIPYVNCLWREGNAIRIESLTMGNASQWIEQTYGEEAVYPIVGADMTEFGSAVFRNEFLKPFPKVKKKLDGYEQVLKRVSKEYGTKLEIRYEGRKGLASFFLDAVVDWNPSDIKSELKAIATAIDGLKEAYQQSSHA
jgi:hypothetical protein